MLFNGEDTALLDAEARARLRLEFLGFVFQFHFLLAEFTILENTMIPMRRLGYLSDSEIHDRGIELLTSLGLGDHIDKRPDQLSGATFNLGCSPDNRCKQSVPKSWTTNQLNHLAPKHQPLRKLPE